MPKFSHLVLRQLLPEEQQLRIGEINEQPEREIEDLRVFGRVVLDQVEQVGLDDADLAQATTDLVVVVIATELQREECRGSLSFCLIIILWTTHESDEVLDALDAVVLLDVVGAVPHTQGGARGLEVAQPVRHGQEVMDARCS